MGLPIRKLILATNENDVLDEFFKSGRYRVRNAAETRATSSPSMDISKASNFERFIFDLTGRDAGLVRALWQQVDQAGGFDLAGTPLAMKLRSAGFVSGRSMHLDRVATIRAIYERYGVVIDPHTADGLRVGLAHREPDAALICIETAQPAKFGATIREAIGRDPQRPAAYQALESLPQRFTPLPADVEVVKAYIAEHAQT